MAGILTEKIHLRIFKGKKTFVSMVWPQYIPT
jgi:hypothetical protein